MNETLLNVFLWLGTFYFGGSLLGAVLKIILIFCGKDE